MHLKEDPICCQLKDQLVQGQFGWKKIGFEKNWKEITCHERPNQISMMSKIEVVFVDLIGCITYTEASQGMREVGTVMKEANKTQKIKGREVVQFPY